MNDSLLPYEETKLYKILSFAHEACIRELLEGKFLYQNNKIDEGKIISIAKQAIRASATNRACSEAVAKYASHAFDFVLRRNFSDVTSQIPIPATINSGCELCSEITPHNPIEISVLPGNMKKQRCVQTICVGMQCQKCKCGRLVVLMKRDGLSFQLVGRNQIDVYDFPYKFEYFANAKDVKAVFVDAVMAERTGSHLAAVCLLRVALEQFMRSAVAPAFSKMRGDELYDEFALHLPDDFPRGRVCSLTEVYGRLSEVMHAPSCYKEGEFNELFDKLLNYFKYLELMPLEKVGQVIVNESKPQLSDEVVSAGGGTNG